MSDFRRILTLLSLLLILHCFGCQSAQKDFDKATQANSEQAYREFIDKHQNHPLAEEARQRLEVVVFEEAVKRDTEKALEKFLQEFPDGSKAAEAQERLTDLLMKKAYRWQPKFDTRGSSSNDLEVTESEKGVMEIKGLSDSSRIAMAIEYSSGRSWLAPDALNSQNIRVVVNPKLGYTTCAGLKFPQNVTVNIWQNGIVEADTAGIVAEDGHGKRYISRKLIYKKKPVYWMIPSE